MKPFYRLQNWVVSALTGSAITHAHLAVQPTPPDPMNPERLDVLVYFAGQGVRIIGPEADALRARLIGMSEDLCAPLGPQVMRCEPGSVFSTGPELGK